MENPLTCVSNCTQCQLMEICPSLFLFNLFFVFFLTSFVWDFISTFFVCLHFFIFFFHMEQCKTWSVTEVQNSNYALIVMLLLLPYAALYCSSPNMFKHHWLGFQAPQAFGANYETTTSESTTHQGVNT